MHFPSYARALWRHHRDGDITGNKGRLFLLLLELATQENRIHDADLVVSILSELDRLKLPRTLLSGCERLASIARCNQLSPRIEELLLQAIATAAKSVLSELHRLMISPETLEEAITGLPTIRRLGRVIQNVADSEAGQKHLIQFGNILVDFLRTARHSEVRTCVAGLALNSACQIKDAALCREMLLKLVCVEYGKLAIQERFAADAMICDDDVGQDSISAALTKLEFSYLPVDSFV
jgi:hypothetical protein